uniref:SusC/RagA family TonB-linked outer membrane protein n=1 Tax=Prevotella sp. TaxID=59823 RepID=UPI004027BD69
MKILLNKKATAALALCLSVSMATQGANTPPVGPSKAKDLSNNLQSQPNIGKYKISGNVAGNNGGPFIGASVVISGTKNGTVTDINGNFTLVSTSETPTLNISYVGFDTQNIKVRQGQSVKVTLKENAQSLEELVVVGYGSQKKVNVIGSIATVDSKSLESRSASDVSNMLTGQMSGVTITQTSGNPGQDGGTIRVRGVGSFGATPSPLVLVDGMPGSLSDLTPDEIENISVLKDASSAAIYGSRAANGVVLVTTKRGKEGRTKVSYNGSVGFSKAAELPEMAHSYDYAKFYNMAIGTDTYTAEDIQKYKDGSDPDNYADENYLDKLFGGHSFLTKHTLSVNGGNDRIQYMATAGYLRHDGLLKNNYYNKYNVRLNLNAKITKDLSMGIRLNGMASDRHEPSTPGQLDTAGYAGIMLAALRYPGLLPSYMSDGSNGNGLKGSGTPVAWVEKCASFYRQDFDKFGGNLDLTYKPIKGLTLKGIGGYKYSLQHVRNYRSEFVTASGRNNGPSSLSDDMYRTVYKTFQATADYNTIIAKKHAIDVLVGYTWEDENQRSVGGYRQKFPSNDVPYLTAGGADGQTNFGGGYDWAIQSIFGRLTYNYDERYLFEATMRYDGSSRFPTDSKY